MNVTDIDYSSVRRDSGDDEDDILTFSGSGTVKKGTILARDSVSLKLVPYVKGGSTNENGIPKAVIGYEVSAAGDKKVRVITAGKVDQDLLIIHTDGDGSNIDAAVIDQLRSFGIKPEKVEQLAHDDNPQDDLDS